MTNVIGWLFCVIDGSSGTTTTGNPLAMAMADCYQLLKSGHLTAQKWTGKKSSDFMR
jgi:hypothetical protein